MIPRHLQITIALLLVGILISGIYIIKLTHKEEAKNLLEMEIRPVGPPAIGRPERIPVLLAYDEDRALRWRQVAVSLPAEVLRAVLGQYLQNPSPHTMGNGSDIKEVYLIDDQTAVVDTTAQFAAGHPSGTLLEEMTICSLIETLSANVPGINRVKFLVDGHERETLAGHADLMSFYQSSAVHEMAKEFE
jgi:hypothetical protein